MNDKQTTTTPERIRGELSQRLREQRPMFERIYEETVDRRSQHEVSIGNRFYL